MAGVMRRYCLRFSSGKHFSWDAATANLPGSVVFLVNAPANVPSSLTRILFEPCHILKGYLETSCSIMSCLVCLVCSVNGMYWSKLTYCCTSTGCIYLWMQFITYLMQLIQSTHMIQCWKCSILNVPVLHNIHSKSTPFQGMLQLSVALGPVLYLSQMRIHRNLWSQPVKHSNILCLKLVIESISKIHVIALKIGHNFCAYSNTFNIPLRYWLDQCMKSRD